MLTIIVMCIRYWLYLECVNRAKAQLRAENPDADMSTFKVTDWNVDPPPHRAYTRTVICDIVIALCVFLIWKLS